MKNYSRLIRKSKILGWIICFIFLIILCWPSSEKYPINKSTYSYWNIRSYWYYPWGKSITHKGIDIYAERNTKAHAPVSGLVIETGYSSNGGNYIYILGPGWKTHYFAHLESILIKPYSIVHKGQVVGLIGNTGNARLRPPHLHYSIFTPIPYLWNYDEFAVEGYQKMFYLNPADSFEN